MANFCFIKLFIICVCVLGAMGQGPGAGGGKCKSELDPCQNGAGICGYQFGTLGCIPYCGYPDPLELPANSALDPIDATESLNFISGAILSYSCYQGYTAVGPQDIFCLTSGQWSPVAFECLRDCGNFVATAPVTLVSQGGTLQGSVASLACQGQGWEAVGDLSAVCNTATGNWDVSDGTCVRVCHGELPQVTHGAYLIGDGQTLHVEEALIVFTCDVGYAGNPHAECTNGGWVVTGACVRDCGTVIPEVANGTPVGEVCATTLGSQMTYTCDYSDETRASVCYDSGWSQPNACPPQSVCDGTLAAVDNGKILAGKDQSFYILGSVILFECDTNFAGSPYAVCRSGGWDVSGSCLLDCGRSGLPEIANGSPTGEICDTTLGSQVTYMCDYSDDVRTSICYETGWSTPNACPPESVCQVTLPTVNNGVVLAGADQTLYVEGAVIMFVCNAGHAGNPYAVCESGTWNVIGGCVRDCGSEFPVVANGALVDENCETTLGNQITYTCQYGEDTPTSTCEESGWSTPETCPSGIDCDTPPGTWDGATLDSFTTTTTDYVCPDGSPLQITCDTGTGSWPDLASISCPVHDCDTPPGTWDGATLDSFTTTTTDYVCPDGSPLQITCDTGTGSWPDLASISCPVHDCDTPPGTWDGATLDSFTTTTTDYVCPDGSPLQITCDTGTGSWPDLASISCPVHDCDTPPGTWDGATLDSFTTTTTDYVCPDGSPLQITCDTGTGSWPDLASISCPVHARMPISCNASQYTGRPADADGYQWDDETCCYYLSAYEFMYISDPYGAMFYCDAGTYAFGLPARMAIAENTEEADLLRIISKAYYGGNSTWTGHYLDTDLTWKTMYDEDPLHLEAITEVEDQIPWETFLVLNGETGEWYTEFWDNALLQAFCKICYEN